MKNRRIVRFIWFGISILAGLALGLLLGWSKGEDRSSRSSFSGLRQDYQIDIVLMVSEIYHKDQDLSAARERLAYLDADDLVLYVQQAVTDAETIGYTKSDLKMMSALLKDLEADSLSGSGKSP